MNSSSFFAMIEMFSRVLLKSKYLNTGLGEVSLPEATADGKTKFHELKVSI